MDLHVQRRLAASVLGCSPSRVRFDPDRLDEIKESITKQDLRSLVSDGAIMKLQAKGVSRVRANVRKEQRKKGRQSGQGSRKGGSETHKESKEDWIARIRVQRAFIKQLISHNAITPETVKDIFRKSKGGFFRSKRHIKLYLEEHALFLTGTPGTATQPSAAADTAKATLKDGMKKTRAQRQAKQSPRDE